MRRVRGSGLQQRRGSVGPVPSPGDPRYFLGSGVLRLEPVGRAKPVRNPCGKPVFLDFPSKSGGRRRIRTFEGVSRQIYSLPSLAT